MQRVNIPSKKLDSGFEMPVFGLGTWKMGGDFDRNPQNDDKKDIEAIKYALDQGITHIDTAEVYADGKSEELIAEAISDLNRKKLFLVSKVNSQRLKYDEVLQSCENSLKRLRTDYLDLFLIHGPSKNGVPLKETMKAMTKLKSDGYIKEIGVSNFGTHLMNQAQDLTHFKIVANQVHYNLIYREVEAKNVLNYCQDNDIMLIAYRPLEKGEILQPDETLHSLTKQYNRTPAQIAINWLISQKNVVTLSKSSTKKHIDENLGAVGWKMDQEDIELLREKYSHQNNTSNLFSLE